MGNCLDCGWPLLEEEKVAGFGLCKDCLERKSQMLWEDVK